MERKTVVVVLAFAIFAIGTAALCGLGNYELNPSEIKEQEYEIY